MLAIVLGLGSSVCWGLADFLGGLQSRRHAVASVLLVSEIAGLAPVVLYVALSGAAAPAWVHLWPAAAGGAAGVVALGAFYRALATGTMSIVAPVSATGAIVPLAVGIAEGDRPGALRLAGIAAALLGVVLAARELGADERPRAGGVNGSVALALVAALGFGLFFVGLRSAASASVPWAMLVARASAVPLVALAVLGARAPLRLGRSVLPALAVVGLLDVSANGLYALATTHGLLSVVSVLGSLYPVTTVLLARLVLHERVRRTQEVGIITVLAGVALIAAG